MKNMIVLVASLSPNKGILLRTKFSRYVEILVMKELHANSLAPKCKYCSLIYMHLDNCRYYCVFNEVYESKDLVANSCRSLRKSLYLMSLLSNKNEKIHIIQS